MRCVLGVLTGILTMAAAGENAFPSSEWESHPPESLGVDASMLDELATQLGGRGMAVKNGYVVKQWGDVAQVGDWMSSAKPVLSTLLFFALEEGLAKSVDQSIAEYGWALSEKDKRITFRHLGAMMSGYARPEAPGAAWAYNDFAIQLYQKTLFDKVFQGDPKAISEDAKRLGALGLQDGLTWTGDKRRLRASVRDFARIAWFWLNKGRWGGQQVLPAKYFDEYMKPQTPKDLPASDKAVTTDDDYLQIGSYGGGSNHFSDAGPGIYGFNWWFNDTGLLHPDALTWPDAPKDTVMSIGAGGNCSVIIPSLNVVVACAEGDWGKVMGGKSGNKLNKKLGLIASACGYQVAKEDSETDTKIGGTMRQWQPLTLSITGPESDETGVLNPFADYRMTVTFSQGDRHVVVPGYFVADGNAAETSAAAGTVWRAHFLPPTAGEWNYNVSLRKGAGIATVDPAEQGEPAPGDGTTGSFTVAEVDTNAPGYLAKGQLEYAGAHYLRFAHTGEYYLKGGVDSPENFLAFHEFDQTTPTHKFEPHAGDWREGDPTWQGGKGKNIIGALNYIASKHMNVVYFLTMNVKGDGKDVWPWTGQDERFRFDVSKLAQWELVFSHMDRLGIMLHIVLQEQENDQLLDEGELGPQRKLYFRELIARFAHHPAIQWNLGEENTNTHEQRLAFAQYLHDLDPYDHPVFVHTFPSQDKEIYVPLLGVDSIEGPSLQLGNPARTHKMTLRWVTDSAKAGRPWVVFIDEIGPADTGVMPDADDPEHDIPRKEALWGNLTAGGAGAEWLFGYKYAHNDINLEDFRSRDRMWDQTWYAMDFFQRHLPFTEMGSRDKAVQGAGWCFAKGEELFAVYTWDAATTTITLPPGRFDASWYNPRAGGKLIPGQPIEGGGVVSMGAPPADPARDWVLLLKRK